MPEKTFPGGRVGGRVVVLNENITTSAPNWAGVGAELGNKIYWPSWCMVVWKLKDYKTFILIHDYNDRNHAILIFFDNLIWSHF